MTEKQLRILAATAPLVGLLMLTANWLLPIPSPGRVAKIRAAEESRLRKSVSETRKRVSSAREENQSRLWLENADQVAAIVMAEVSARAAQHGLKVLAFRPQRTQDDEGVIRQPFNVTLQGAYPQVLLLLKELESPERKLVIGMLQVASSDEQTDVVTATTGILAYKEREDKP